MSCHASGPSLSKQIKQRARIISPRPHTKRRLQFPCFWHSCWNTSLFSIVWTCMVYSLPQTLTNWSTRLFLKAFQLSTDGERQIADHDEPWLLCLLETPQMNHIYEHEPKDPNFSSHFAGCLGLRRQPKSNQTDMAGFDQSKSDHINILDSTIRTNCR